MSVQKDHAFLVSQNFYYLFQLIKKVTCLILNIFTKKYEIIPILLLSFTRRKKLNMYCITFVQAVKNFTQLTLRYLYHNFSLQDTIILLQGKL